jgi:YVTN family beta-propeller protein/VCBS repeat-containing protein
MLAAARKELDGPSAPVNTTTATTTSLALRTTAVAAVAVNLPPVVDPQEIYVDQATGTITGTLGASDPENKKLTYTLKTGPTVGKLVFDTKTGTFTYTPTTAQRVLAAVGTPQTAMFTATVSDGVMANVQTVQVTLTVPPAPITDKGVIAAGSTTVDSSIAITNTRAYVTNYDDDTVTVIDTINRLTIGTITLAEKPFGIAVTPDGKRLYVTDDTTNLISVYDATPATPTFLSTIDFGDSRYPLGLSTSPDGKTLYAAGGLYDAKTGQWNTVVTKVSTTTDKVIGTVKVPGASDSFYAMDFTPDGKKIYVIADLLTDDPDAIPVSALFSFSSTATTAKQIATGAYFIGLAISPDGKRVYLNDVDAGTVSVFDTTTDKVIDTFANPVATLAGFTVSNDGTVLYAVDTATNSVVAFETVTGNYAQLATTPVGSTTADFYPGTKVSPDGQQLVYVSDTGLQVISLVPNNAFPTVSPTVGTPSATGVVAGAVGGNDADDDRLKYTTTSAPAKGTLVLNAATGAFTYTPTATARHIASALNATTADKTDTFTVTIDDGRRGIITTTITVDILSANALPTVKATAGTPNSTTGIATGTVVGTDKDKDLLTYASPVGGTSAKGGTVTIDAKGKFVYTPSAALRHAAAATGASAADKTDSFTVTVADGHGDPVTVTVSVKIAPANAKPTGATATVGQANTSSGAVTGTITAVDADLDDFTVTGPMKTTKGTISYDNATDTFVYTPTAAARLAAGATNASAPTKTDKFTVTISDGHGGTTTASVTVNVAPNKAPLAGTSTVGAPGGDQSVVTGTASATDPDGDTITYGLKSPLDVKIGEVAVDAETGVWQFKASGLARYNAYFTPSVDTASFSIMASDGKGGTTEIKVVAPVDPGAVVSYEDVRSLQGSRPGGIAVASDGTIYVSNYGQDFGGIGLTVLHPDGSTDTASFGGNSSFGVAIGKDGYVYATSNTASNGQVWRINPASPSTPTLFATLPFSTTAIAVDGAGKLNVASVDFVTGKSTVSVLSAAGTVAKTLSFDGVVAGIAAGPGNKTYFAVSAQDGSTGSLVIISSTGSRKTVSLGMAAFGVAVDSAGRAYVSTVTAGSSGAATAGFLQVVNPDYSVTAPLTLDGEGWIGLTMAAGGKLWGTATSTNTANQIELVQPWQGDYQYGDIDSDTGAVHGVVLTLNPGNNFAYSLTTPADPALGTVTVDSTTGDWVFTPTAQARIDAATMGDDLWASFAITGSYGQSTQTAQIEVWVEPAVGDFGYQPSTITGLGFTPAAIAVASDGRLVVSGVDVANQSSGTLNVVGTNGSVSSTIQLPGPSLGVAMRSDGRVYVANSLTGQIRIYDPANLGAGTPFATVPLAAALAVDASGKLYVSSGVDATHPTPRLTILNANGTIARVIDLDVTPLGVAIGPDGKVYVSHISTNGGNASILVYGAGNDPATIDIGQTLPYGIGVAIDGTIYVADNAHNQVVVVKTDGSTATVAVAQPFGIAVGSEGRVYVTSLDGTITVITRTFISQIV